MSLIHIPLSPTETRRSAAAGSMVWVMQIGQHLMAVTLTAVGVIRAIGDGVPAPAAVITGLAILLWHTAGSLLPARARTTKFIVWWLVGFAVVWITAVTISAEFIWLAFVLWLLAGHLLPLGWGLAFSLVVLGVATFAPVMHHGVTSYANVLGPLIGGIFAFGISRGYLQLLREAAERERLVASLTAAQHEMAGLQDELAHAQRHSGVIAERTRLSRDIHDTIAQGLSSIRLLAHAEITRGDGTYADANVQTHESRTLEQIEHLAGTSLADVRRIIAALVPTELDDNALAAALQRMLDRVHEETNINAELHVDESLPALPTDVEVALLRTAQSAIANVRLHARASRLVVSLIDADDTVRLDITDNGIGFDISEWERNRAGASSFGLRFMRARLRELGGGLDLESTTGEGTSVSVHLPIRPSTTISTSPHPSSEAP